MEIEQASIPLSKQALIGREATLGWSRGLTQGSKMAASYVHRSELWMCSTVRNQMRYLIVKAACESLNSLPISPLTTICGMLRYPNMARICDIPEPWAQRFLHIENIHRQISLKYSSGIFKKIDFRIFKFRIIIINIRVTGLQCRSPGNCVCTNTVF